MKFLNKKKKKNNIRKEKKNLISNINIIKNIFKENRYKIQMN